MNVTSSISRGHGPAMALRYSNQRSSSTPALVRKVVQDELASIKQRSPEDLLHLPASDVERFVGDDNRHIAVATYHGDLGEGRHFVVVHGFREWLHGIFATSVVTAGIAFSTAGNVHVLTPGELADCLQLLGL